MSPAPVFLASLLVIALDQGTKLIARSTILYGDERPFIPGLVGLTHVHNTGAAFGLFQSSTFGLIAVSVIVCLAILLGQSWWLRGGLSLRFAVALELGGAVGNLIDRLARGYVIDFIQLVPELPLVGKWPAFNVADSALTCGALIMGISLLLQRTPLPAAASDAPSEGAAVADLDRGGSV